MLVLVINFPIMIPKRGDKCQWADAMANGGKKGGEGVIKSWIP